MFTRIISWLLSPIKIYKKNKIKKQKLKKIKEKDPFIYE